MRDLREIQRAARRRLARLVDAPVPAKVEQESPSDDYYPQVDSCQIPTFGYLLSCFLGERGEGTFVEIGANDGVYVSNTWGLAERGWRGWMVEPVPGLALACRRNHVQHANVSVSQHAIGPEGVSEVRLHLAGVLTTANTALAAEYATTSWSKNMLTGDELVVPAMTLSQFLAESEVPAGFDLLVVDVEGLEAEIFSAFDLAHWRPRMIVVELVDTHPDLQSTAAADAELGESIAEIGYRVIYKDHINTVFVRRDVWRAAYGLRS